MRACADRRSTVLRPTRGTVGALATIELVASPNPVSAFPPFLTQTMTGMRRALAGSHPGPADWSRPALASIFTQRQENPSRPISSIFSPPAGCLSIAQGTVCCGVDCTCLFFLGAICISNFCYWPLQSELPPAVAAMRGINQCLVYQYACVFS